MSRPHRILLGDNACYALPLEDGGVLLIDAGPDFDAAGGGTWELAVEQARAGGFTPRDVRYVVVTHGHIDHAGLAARWAAEGARIVVGAADRAALEAGRTSNEAQRALRLDELRRHGCPEPVVEHLAGLRGTRGLRWEPCPSDALVNAEDMPAFRLDGGATLRLIAAPGHTPGNLVAWVEATDDLYPGDTILPTTIPTPGLHFPTATRWPSLPSFLRSVEALARLPARRVLPGHGEVVEEPARLFARFAVHHERRARRVRAALHASAERTAYEVVQSIFPRLPDSRIGQAMTEVIGHLDVLEEAHAVEVRETRPVGGPAVRRYRLRNEGRASSLG